MHSLIGIVPVSCLPLSTVSVMAVSYIQLFQRTFCRPRDNGAYRSAWTCCFGIGLATEDPAMFGMAEGRLQGFGGVYMLLMEL